MTKALSSEEAYKKLKEAHGDAIIMTNYYRTNSMANFECAICGYKWETKPTNVINAGEGCYVCAHKRIGQKEFLSEKEVKKQLKSIHSDKLSILKYGGTTHSISIFRCNTCGNIWESNLHAVLIQKYGCKKCWFKEIGRIKSGSNSNLWKGGVTALRPFIKGCLE